MDRTDALLDTGGGGLLGSLNEGPSVLLVILVVVFVSSGVVEDWLSSIFNDDDDAEANFVLPIDDELVDDESCEMN